MELVSIILVIIIVLLGSAFLTKLWGFKLRSLKGDIFFISFICIYLLIAYYPVLRIGSHLQLFNTLYFQIISLILVVSPLLSILLNKTLKGKLTYNFFNIAMSWMGIVFILFTVTLFSEIILLFIPLDTIILGYTILSITFILILFGIFNANRIHIKKIKLQSSKVKKEYSIVQITDVHIGSISDKQFNFIINKICKIDPDYVLITGDLIDEHNVSISRLKPFKKIKAPMYFVTGNHERYVDLENFIQKLESLKIKVLRTQSDTKEDLQFIGIDDSDDVNQVKNKLKNIKVDSKKYSILLYHKPSGFDDAAKKGIDLKLAGHTHAGQIFPFNLLVRLQFKEVKGMFTKGKSLMYVSPGTGTWGPRIRIGSSNEITLFNLKPKN